MNILGHRLLVVARHRLGRLAEAAQVRRDHCMILCQLSHQWPPHMTVFSIAMQENYGIAFAGDQIMKPDSVDARETSIDPTPRLCMTGGVSCQYQHENRGTAMKSTLEHFHR